jgi:FkbM family methyltransferase
VRVAAKLVKVRGRVEGQDVELVVQDRPDVVSLCRALLDGEDYPPVPLGGWDPGLVVDIGANVGATALLFAHRYPKAIVHAVEPAAQTLALLRHNARASERIVVHGVALLDQEGIGVLHHGGTHDQQHSLMGSRETGSRAEQVQVRLAREFIAELGVPGLLKVDTEGAEVPILQDLGAVGILEQIEVVYYEFHSRVDRIELDQLLRRTHVQFVGLQNGIHRGTCGWLHKRRFEMHARLDLLRVRRPGGG